MTQDLDDLSMMTTPLYNTYRNYIRHCITPLSRSPRHSTDLLQALTLSMPRLETTLQFFSKTANNMSSNKLSHLEQPNYTCASVVWARTQVEGPGVNFSR